MVKGLMTHRSIDFISALTVAELGDLRRFPHPREFMSYLGLVPSEHSSGNSKQRGNVTKTGNTHVRRILVEAAWNDRLPARIVNRSSLGWKGNLGTSSTSRGKRSFGSAKYSAAFGHEADIRTRRALQSLVNYADSSGTSERDCSQPEHFGNLLSTSFQ
jgi:hypothetical protein